MAPDPQNASLPPRRTLADLPPELKAIIARMARDQDSAYEERMPSDKREREMALLGKRDWDGRSARALSLVDRSWHSAAVPLLFETITSRRCSSNIFGFRIASRFARFVKRASFDSSYLQPHDNYEEDWKALLRALPFFGNLEHINFSDEASSILFGYDQDEGPTEDQVTFRESLKSISSSIQSLQLLPSTPDTFLWMLPPFINLRRFRWSICQEEDWASILPAVQALGRCSTLEHLDLEGASEGLLAQFVQEGWEPSWPNLRSLALKFDDEELGVSAWSFIRSFRETLESITLRLDHPGLADDLLKETEAPLTGFPNLRRLTIKDGFVDTEVASLLKLFSGSPVRHLDLSVYDSDWEDPPTVLLETALQLFPTHLRSVHLDYQPFYHGSHLHSLAPTLASLAPARNISVTLAPSYDVFLHRPLLEMSRILPSDDVDDNCDQLEELLRSGLRQTAGLRASRDGVAIDRLREALEPLKASMMRARD
ncbi:hypothetical protein BCR35DRAFT_311032 [Leucosporidium creatinivorum]|uniref:Uncharacterized protein n=1 Tax=Leucosporidium creatinivorum TaxID=106004 RepID=A0A1Y2CHC0_9BASI|nr:hypothetical protein BCR35DRAFT_311032 [Leucosporidium creatinivorum]